MNNQNDMSILITANNRKKDWVNTHGFKPRFLLAGRTEYDTIVEQMRGMGNDIAPFAADCVVTIFEMRVLRLDTEYFFEIAG